MKPVEAVVVSHTHWDREWYLPFQQFRARLVALVDYLLDLLERDESFRCFTLDGQAVVLEDYLEVRPENEDRLRRLIQGRRLLVGPWYVLPDEFLSSEEAMVRNLLLGARVARRFGAVMRVGYVPDPFGHIRQLPQILQGFGIASAIFSRGMGDEGESLGAEFMWRSPDGSEVLALWLPAHYGSFTPVGSFNPWASDARFAAGDRESMPLDEAVRFTRDLARFLAARSRTGVVLLDTGSDHLAPRADLPEIISELQAALNEAALGEAALGEAARARCSGQERSDGVRDEVRADEAGAVPRDGKVLAIRLAQGSFEDYVEMVRARVAPGGDGDAGCESSTAIGWPECGCRRPVLPVYEGEFRGSRYQNMLYSVLSSRMPLKQLNQEVDAWLTCYAEPLASAAWLLAGTGYPSAMLGLAWKLYLQNQAHDSICGCSTDEVAAEMTARYTQAREIAVAVCTESLASISRRAKTVRASGGAGAYGSSTQPVLVYNPNPWPVSGIVTVHVPCDEMAGDTASVCGRADCSATQGSADDTADTAGCSPLPGATASTSTGGCQYFVSAGEGDDAVRVQVLRCGGAEPGFDPSALFHDAVRRGKPAMHLAFPVRDVPAVGYRVYHLSRGPRGHVQGGWGCSAPSAHGVADADAAATFVAVGERSLENEFLKVQVSLCGALDILDKRTGLTYHGLNVFEDSGDAGDEYDYSPVPDEPLTTRNVTASVGVEEPGPYLGRLRVEIPWEIPASLDPGRKRRASTCVPLSIVTHVTLAAGAPYVEIRTEVSNAARDHRLRALFPAGVRADRVVARGQFDAVERAQRPRHTGDDWFQPEAAVGPHQGFVDVGDGTRGLAVATRGLPEYECVEERDGTSTIAVTLLRCVEWLSRDDLATRKGHAGPPVFTPGAQCLGRHVFEYAIVPHSGDWSNAATGSIMSIVRRFMCPCVAYLATPHEGDLPSELGLLRLCDGKGGDDDEAVFALAVSAVKKAEDGNALVVRVHNPGERDIGARLKAGIRLEGACLARLDETPVAPVRLEPGSGCELVVDVKPKQIVTLVLVPGSALSPLA